MAYVKTNWTNGSSPPLNATNLNKIEDGISAAITPEVISDFNYATSPGFYTVSGSVLNAPVPGNYFSLVVINSTYNNENYLHQIALPETTRNIYIRNRSSSWGPWCRVWTTDNIIISSSNSSIPNVINGAIWIKYSE